MSSGKPVLWHIPISHYNEKARWALDYKGVDHERKETPPPANVPIAYALTRGKSYTVPLLQLNGRAIGDSTAIIAALEEAYPDPPLYPADPAERERALALEDFFDEELGPYARLLGFHEMRKDPDAMAQVAGSMLPGPLGESPRVTMVVGRMASGYAQLRYKAGSDEEAALARKKTIAAMDRLDEELAKGDGVHLVGHAFSVADLTAASLFNPLVAPPEGPKLPDPTPEYEAFRSTLRARPGWAWVEETFARERNRTPAPSPAA